MKNELLICPICKNSLNKSENTYKCISNHSYDISKNGYVNLLLNFDKNSLVPGDTKESLQARNKFMKKEYYKKILDSIIETINKYNQETNVNILDIGCGEGYYTSGIKNTINNSYVYGFDISKDAISLATKYTRDILWFVANSKNIPIKTNSIDFILSWFSFVTEKEIERVLKDNGYIISVVAGKNHLSELKQMIYNDIKEKDEKNTLLNFELIETKNMTYKINFNNNEDIINLFKMTPHYYRTNKDKKDIFNNINNLEVTIDININIYKK